MNRAVPILSALLVTAVSCVQRPVDNPNIIVFGVQTAPNNLDPRIGTRIDGDDGAKAAQVAISQILAELSACPQTV